MAAQYLLSSDYTGTPVANAATGDRFTVRLATPFVVTDADEYGVLVTGARCWYTSPNVSAARSNNNFVFASATVAPTGTHVITVPDGLYSAESLTEYIASETEALGFGTLSSPLFTFNPLRSIQKVSITIDPHNSIGTGFSVDAGVVDSLVASLFGFVPGDLSTTTRSPETFTPAALSNMTQGVNEYLLNTDLIRGSVGTNGASTQALIRLPLNVAPTGQLTYVGRLDRQILPLARNRTSTISAWVTDGNGNPITLNNNAFSIDLTIVRIPKEERIVTVRNVG